MTESADTLLWRLEFAYRNPHREYILMEAHNEIERLRAEVARLDEALQQAWAIVFQAVHGE